VPISEGKLVLGTWRQIFHLEQRAWARARNRCDRDRWRETIHPRL